MLDHVSLHVSDYEKSKLFFSALLAPLEYTLITDFPEWKAAGFGVAGKPDFWIAEKELNPDHHIAFQANSRELVDAFFRAGLAAGGKDNGAPGLRPQYHANYYGAFIIDPDGNNIEAVCHLPLELA